MQIEITNVSVSKKGTVWLQAKMLSQDGAPIAGAVFECEFTGEVKVKKEKNNDDSTTETKA